MKVSTPASAYVKQISDIVHDLHEEQVFKNDQICPNIAPRAQLHDVISALQKIYHEEIK